MQHPPKAPLLSSTLLHHHSARPHAGTTKRVWSNQAETHFSSRSSPLLLLIIDYYVPPKVPEDEYSTYQRFLRYTSTTYEPSTSTLVRSLPKLAPGTAEL